MKKSSLPVNDKDRLDLQVLEVGKAVAESLLSVGLLSDPYNPR